MAASRSSSQSINAREETNEHLTTRTHEGIRRGCCCAGHRRPFRHGLGGGKSGPSRRNRSRQHRRARVQDRQFRDARRRGAQAHIGPPLRLHRPGRRRRDLSRESPRVQRFPDPAAAPARHQRGGDRPAHHTPGSRSAVPDDHLSDGRTRHVPRQGRGRDLRRHRDGRHALCLVRRGQQADGGHRQGDARPEMVPDLHEPRHGD